jgi:uncharacterized protein (DUF1501 family)
MTHTTRRRFLQSSSAMAVAGNLASIGQAAAQSSGATDDYKALVCVFLMGGNDHGNTLIPFDTPNYDAYRKFRDSLAYVKSSSPLIGRGGGSAVAVSSNANMLPLQGLSNLELNPISGRTLNASMAGRSYALPPPLTAFHSKFNAGRLAVLLNVGPLIEPLTAAEYTSRTRSVGNTTRPALIPPSIASHNDQTSFWQSGGIEGASVGWGGLIGDEVLNGNNTSPFTCISIQGNAVFLRGKEALQYQLASSGPVDFDPLRKPLFGSAKCSDVLGQIITGATLPDASLTDNVFAYEHAAITSRAIANGDVLKEALDSTQPTSAPTKAALTKLSNLGNLGAQLAMVAKTMHACRQALGLRRQVFFVGIGGFDTHSDLVNVHQNLLRSVGESMAAFDDALVTLSLGDQVTSFTASDFGRQFVSNGSGSDHGWGAMHFVLGGAVKGGTFYGQAPTVLSSSSIDFVNEYHAGTTGMLVPSMSVDQVATTMAVWMGVSQLRAEALFPMVRNFPLTNLGFV